MNGQNWRPPDEGKSNQISHQDDQSLLNLIGIKQETVKQKPENVVNIVTVPGLERAAHGLVVNSTGGEQRAGIYDFTNIGEFAEAKSDVKKEKIDKEAEKNSAEFSGNDAIGPPSSDDTKDNHWNKKQSKSTRGAFGVKKAKKSATAARNKPKANIRNNKKKMTASKRTGKHIPSD